MKNLGHAGLLLAICVATAACKSEQATDSATKPEASEAPSAPAPTTPVVDSEIANAAKAVTKGAQAPGQAADGPPPDGILGAERAAAELAVGAPPKVVVGKVGDGPRYQLGGPPVSSARNGQMTLSVRTGMRTALPTVDLSLEVTGHSPETGAAGLKVAISGLKLNAQQPGALPPSLSASLSTLTGSSIDYTLTPAGAALNPRLTPAPKADPQVQGILEAAQDALTPIAIAYPAEPLGVGAIWMVTLREQFSTAEVMSYHLYEVSELSAGRAVLTVKTQRYLIEPQIAGNAALRFVATGSGDWVVTPGQRLPIEGRVQQSLQALVQTADGEPEPIQWDQRALYAFPVLDDNLTKPVDKVDPQQAPGSRAAAASAAAPPGSPAGAAPAAAPRAPATP